MKLFTRTRFGVVDALVALGLLALALWIGWRALVVLDYDFDFARLLPFFVRYDEASDTWHANILLQGLVTTIRLAVVSTLLATCIGIIMGTLRATGRPFWRLIASTYVQVVRNIPPLVLIFLFYFFLSDAVLSAVGAGAFFDSLTGWPATLVEWLTGSTRMAPSFIAAVITLSIYEGAYITEIVRGGIESVGRGQWEASYALGLSPWQRLRHVIGPQALRRVVPQLAGQLISTIKDSSIVSVISIGELTFQGMELMSTTYLTFEIWITIGVCYLLLCLALSRLAAWVERALSPASQR